MSSESVEGVLIAGGGAVGLTTALSLARRGVPVTVLEGEAEIVKEFRGSTFHPPTLEMLVNLGVGQKLLARGVKADTVQYRDRKKGLVAEFDLGRLKDYTRYPFRLQIDQYALAVLLLDSLQKLPNASVVFNHQVTDVAASGDHAVVTAEMPDGVKKQFRAPYVVGADGGNSAVRRSMDIAFEGITYPERYITLFTTFDFAAHLPDFASVNYISDPEEWCIMLRSPDIWRVLFPTRQEESDEDVLEDDSIQPRLQGIVATGKPYEIVHRRVYKIHQRVAATYRKGRVLLAGDSAHVNNPMGGMGLNGGIHDAVDLAEKMARVWHGEAGDDALEAYANERRRVALEHVQKQTHQNALQMSETNEKARKRQQDEMRRIASDPALSLQHMLRMSMIAGLRTT